MKLFWIYAIILTFCLIAYYAYTIMQDLYGKKLEKNTDTEDIDLPSDDESPIHIEESIPRVEEEGFPTPSPFRKAEPEPVKSPRSSEDDIMYYDREHPEGISGKEKIRRAQLQFEEVDVDSTGGIDDIKFSDMLVKSSPDDPRVKIRIDRI